VTDYLGTPIQIIAGISDRNFGKKGKKLKGDIYMDAFYNENPDLKKIKSHH